MNKKILTQTNNEKHPQETRKESQSHEEFRNCKNQNVEKIPISGKNIVEIRATK